MAWLIDPLRQHVYIYKPHEDMVVLENPEVVSGNAVLPGFELKTSDLW